MSEIELAQGTVEYLYADVTADHILDSQPVRIAVATSVTTAVWQEATWVGDPGLTRSARLLLDGSLGAGKYGVFVQITDEPEIPIFKAGVVRVKSN